MGGIQYARWWTPGDTYTFYGVLHVGESVTDNHLFTVFRTQDQGVWLVVFAAGHFSVAVDADLPLDAQFQEVCAGVVRLVSERPAPLRPDGEELVTNHD